MFSGITTCRFRLDQKEETGQVVETAKYNEFLKIKTFPTGFCEHNQGIPCISI